MLQQKLKANKKIEIIWDSVVDEVLGDKEPKGVNGIKIKNVKNNEIKTFQPLAPPYIPCQQRLPLA